MIIHKISIFLLLLSSAAMLQASEEAKQFTPGKIWKDNNAIHINAHGGGIIHHKGKYYWFGEHKISGAEGNKAHVGVHVYTSDNLTSWTDAGIALRMSDDPESDIVKGAVIERPKVIYNKQVSL